MITRHMLMRAAGITGGVVMIVAAFLPWYSMHGIALSGMDDGAGWFFIAAGLAITATHAAKWSVHLPALLLALVAVGWSVWQLAGLEQPATIGLAYGLPLLLAGGILSTTGSAFAMRAALLAPLPDPSSSDNDAI